jgi:hypothetical protein
MSIITDWSKFEADDPDNAKLIKAMFTRIYALGYVSGQEAAVDTNNNLVLPIARARVNDLCGKAQIKSILEDSLHEIVGPTPL